MTEEQCNYEMGCAGQAEAEYQAQMAYYEYLDGLIESKQYQLHAIEVCLDMLISEDFAHSNKTPKQYLEDKKIAILNLPKVIKEGDMTPLSEIKAQIKRDFVKQIEDEIAICKSLLNSSDWANTNDNYHKECRIRKKLELEYFEKILKKII